MTALLVSPVALPEARLGSLLAAVAAGDSAAWEPLVARAHRLLVRAAAGVDPALAEDAVQEALLRLEDLAKGFRDDGDERRAAAWLCAIAVNCARNLRRSETARLRHERRAGRDQRPAAEELPASGHGEQFSAQLPTALAELPERERQALAWRYLEGVEHREVALRLGVPAGHAAVIVHRALKHLRQILQRRGLAAGAAGLVLALRRLEARESGVDSASAAGGAAAWAGVAAMAVTLAAVLAQSVPPVSPEAVVSPAPVVMTALIPASDAVPSPASAPDFAHWRGLARGALPRLRRPLTTAELGFTGQAGTRLDADGVTWLAGPTGDLELEFAALPVAALARPGDAAAWSVSLLLPAEGTFQQFVPVGVAPLGQALRPVAVLGGTVQDGWRHLPLTLDVQRLPAAADGQPRYAVALRIAQIHAIHQEFLLTEADLAWRLHLPGQSRLRYHDAHWTPLQPRPLVRPEQRPRGGPGEPAPPADF